MGVRGTVTVPSDSDFRLTTWTARCNVRIEQEPGVGEILPLFTLGNPDATDKTPIYLAYVNVAGALSLRAGFIEDGTLAFRSSTAAYTLAVGRWYYVAATFDLATRALKVWAGARWDEDVAPVDLSSLTLVISATLPGAAAPSTAGTADLTIGGPYVSSSEVALSDTVLDQAALEADMLQRLDGYASGIMGCWPLDDGRDAQLDGTDRLAWDISQRGHDGVLARTAEWTDDPHDLRYPCGTFPYFSLGWLSGTRLAECIYTVTGEEADYPGANLLDPLQARQWRGASNDILFDFGAPFSCGLIAMDGHSLTSLSRCTVRWYKTNPAGDPDVITPLRRHPRRVRQFYSLPQEYRYARFTFSGPGVRHIGTIHLFATWEPSRDCCIASSVALQDAGARGETVHGNDVTRSTPVTADYSYMFTDLRRGEADALVDIVRKVGGGQPVVAIEDPGRNLYRASPYGFMTQLPTRAHAGRSGVFYSVGPIGIREDRPLVTP